MSENKIERDAFDWAYDRYVKSDDSLVKFFNELDTKLAIARELHDLRIQRDLTREDVASLVGVSPETIEDIEEADYQGDFLAMAVRVAAALQRKLEIHLVAMDQTDVPAYPAL
ncbi:MAG: helix-turn-helix transcriptional regulator [Desulfomonilaceae bacterium]